MVGTEERWAYTFQTDERLGKPRHRREESGVGTKRRTEEFVILELELTRFR